MRAAMVARHILTQIIVAGLISFASLPARAEYRAFLLSIADASGAQKRTVTSILDQYQYPGYYPLNPGEIITMTDTWMCWGRQGEDIKICPNPKPKAQEAKR